MNRKRYHPNRRSTIRNLCFSKAQSSWLIEITKQLKETSLIQNNAEFGTNQRNTNIWKS